MAVRYRRDSVGKRISPERRFSWSGKLRVGSSCEETFDEFVSTNPAAQAVYTSLPNSNHVSMSELCQSDTLQTSKQNRSLGYVNSSAADAKQCYDIALAVVCGLREMDKVRYAKV